MYLQVNPNAIFVHKRQEGNPVLKHIRNVRWQFADIVPDYQMGQTTCAVFLSLRYTTVRKALPMISVHRVLLQRQPDLYCAELFWSQILLFRAVLFANETGLLPI